jgi:hypothetical protein
MQVAKILVAIKELDLRKSCAHAGVRTGVGGQHRKGVVDPTTNAEGPLTPSSIEKLEEEWL